MALWTKASLCVKSSLLEQSLPRTPSRPKTSIISVNPVILSNLSSCLGVFVAKNPCNQRNPRLKILFVPVHGIFTTVERALQISLFMQNEPNFRKSQMNINKVLTRDYEKRTLGESGKNEPNTNPKRSQLKPIKANKMPKQTQSNPTCSELACPACPACPERCRRDRTYFKGKKMCLDAPKMLTITIMDANFKKSMVFWLFIERTLFGR